MIRNQPYDALKRALRTEVILIVVTVTAAAVARLVFGPRIIGGYTVLAALALTALLMAGAVHWRARSTSRRPMPRQALLGLYGVGLVSVLAYPLAFLLGLLSDTLIGAFPDAVVAIPVYGLTVVAFLHHGLVKLIRSETDQRARSQRRQVTARWMRELARQERRTETLR